MRIKCPKCKEDAELSQDFSVVRCNACEFDASYGEYVKYVAHNDPTYSDILGDYARNAKGQRSESLDDWD